MDADDCTVGIARVMTSDIDEPIDFGSSETVTINQPLDIVECVARVRLKRRDRLDARQGVESRSSGNTLILGRLGWQPSVPLRAGPDQTFAWIAPMKVRRAGEPVVG